MQPSYEKAKNTHRFLFGLIEMRDVEEILTEESTLVTERTDFQPAKNVFNSTPTTQGNTGRPFKR